MKFITLYMLLLLTSCGYINPKLGLSDDNVGEELVEELIELKTGWDIDLSPGSPE